MKIGLVHYSEGRDSYGRLSEHQTGNPRRLVLDDSHIVKTQAVDMVEAQLHRRFATSRISGEWFELPGEKELKEAISEATKLAALVDSYMPKFEEAIRLGNTESNGNIRHGTKDEIEWATRLVTARKQSSVCADIESEIKAFISKSVSEGNDPGVAAKNSLRTYKPKFDEKDFREKHMDLWGRYQKSVKSWDSALKPAFRAQSLGSEFEASTDAVRRSLAEVTASKNYTEIVEMNLVLTNLKGLADWEAKVSEAELKSLIGLDEQVTGVATWKRGYKATEKFDEATFAEDNPDLYKSFIYTPAPTTLVNLKKSKG